MQNVGARIAEARRTAGLTQVQLAAQLGVSDKAVQRWESSEFAPRASRLSAIASALGKPPAWFLGGDEPQTVTATVRGNTVSGSPAEVAEVLRRLSPDEQSAAWPGVAALLGDAGLCELLGVTAEERQLLETGVHLPHGPRTKLEALLMLETLRVFPGWPGPAGRRG